MACLISLPGCTGCQSNPLEAPPPDAAESDDARSASTASPPQPEDHPNPATAPESSSSTEAENDGGGSAAAGLQTSERVESTAPPGDAAGSTAAETADQTFATPAQALAAARDLKKQSEKAAASRQYGDAFRLGSEAWRAAHAYSDDPGCKALASEMLPLLDRWGTRANQKHSDELLDDKPLILK